jgi:predicted transporter
MTSTLGRLPRFAVGYRTAVWSLHVSSGLYRLKMVLHPSWAHLRPTPCCLTGLAVSSLYARIGSCSSMPTPFAALDIG